MISLDEFFESCDLLASRSRSAYIAVSGNTGAGKSTLIRNVSGRIQDEGLSLISVDERLLHHRLLTCMFSSPIIFALPIQLNFMLQRWFVIRFLHERGLPFLIERPHIDDWLFAEEHRARGNIGEDAHEGYTKIAVALDAVMPRPDLLFLVNPSPEVSYARITAAEKSGERPAEFPNDAEKRSWIESWFIRYDGLHARYLSSSDSAYPVAGKIVSINPNAAPDETVEVVLQHVRLLLLSREPVCSAP